MNETVCDAPRRHVTKMRVHDYLYDSSFVVSGAKDYARTAFRAAMASAQVVIQPVYHTMFSEIRKCPRMKVVYHPNCRLPEHMDRSYGGYMVRVQRARDLPTPEFAGKDRFKFSAMPKQILPIPSATPEFNPPTPVYSSPMSPRQRTRAVQSTYRESSAQTRPWQPDGKPSDRCQTTPEVLYLDKLEWGPGKPYRTGDLPADFHTTEIINKLRHARCWSQLVENGVCPRWMKNIDSVIVDVETKDWIFREAEIDELQNIRLALLHQLQLQQRQDQTSRVSRKLDKLWTAKKHEMEKKIDLIRKTRDRELRKLTALHGGSGRAGLVQRMRASRGSETMTLAADDPTSDLYAPLARHGYQARRRHADIEYDPTLLSLEDHERIAKPPAWLDACGQDLKRSCSGHHLLRDQKQLCERETKWSEQFLENLHNDLKKARLGAASMSAGPLHVLKPRHVLHAARATTPVVDSVDDEEENSYQAALLLQKIIRGRAVQNLMYEGLSRASELTEELKTTHGLQKEDKIRIAHEDAKAREYNAVHTVAEQKDKAITALVDELVGGAVSAALDFLEKELCRLKEERRQHAFIMIAVREKEMREAAEAGRRQKEERRRQEHDEMFKQVLGVTQETVDVYLREVIAEGIELAAEQEAVQRAQHAADKVDQSLREHGSISTAEQNELVAELVQQFLLPEVHKTASRHRVSSLQRANIDIARKAIFGLLDDAEIREPTCVYCRAPSGDLCRCTACPITQVPTETSSRDDPRWKHTRTRSRLEEKTPGERFPPAYDVRLMLDALVDEAVLQSRAHSTDVCAVHHLYGQRIRERTEVALDAKDIVEKIIDRATGTVSPPVRKRDYHHFMLRVVGDALERSVPFRGHDTCNKELPSEIRRREEASSSQDPTCYCVEQERTKSSNVKFETDEEAMLLPSELRMLEEMRRCKCDLRSESTVTASSEDAAAAEVYDTTPTEHEETPLDDD